jgi:hypothetical protein
MREHHNLTRQHFTAAPPATARLTPSQVGEAAREYLHGWDSPDPVEATARHGLSPVDAERLAEAYGPRDGRRVGRALVALCRSRSGRALVARALRAIPSEARSEQSRSNGAKGGRRPTVYTLTSAKGKHGTVSGYRAAVARARDVQAEMQAAYGVDVTAPDGRTVYTAR